MQRNETAAQAYTRYVNDVLGQLDLIREAVLIAREPDFTVDWAHVGTYSQVREWLEEVLSFLNINKEDE